MARFVAPNDPVLLKKALVVAKNEINAASTNQSISKMLKIALGEQADRTKPILVGLAAPQIGISKRIILVDVQAEGHGEAGKLQVYINPEIIWRSEDVVEWYEGCYSTDRVCGIVSRPNVVKIRAYDESREIVEEEHSGYIARIFQHEIDHLDGKEFITHITDDNNLHWVEDDQFPVYRDKENWRVWPKKCSRDKWNRIKGVS